MAASPVLAINRKRKHESFGPGSWDRDTGTGALKNTMIPSPEKRLTMLSIG